MLLIAAVHIYSLTQEQGLNPSLSLFPFSPMLLPLSLFIVFDLQRSNSVCLESSKRTDH